MTTPAPTSPADGDINVGVLVWIFFCMYIVCLIGLALYGLYRSGKLENKEEMIEDHWVASRGVGTFVLLLTVFATVSSGYTAVGVPGDVWLNGYFGLRWFYCLGVMVYPIIFISSKLQYIGAERKYVSATDFIKDRYKSQSLAMFTSASMVFPAVAYALAQFKAMGATIQEISNNSIDDFLAARILCFIMIFYEVLGGLRAIAYTDVIQGVVLLGAYLLFYIAQEDIFGGISEAKRVMSEAGLNKMLTKDEVQSWVGFGMMTSISYALYPQMIVRYQAARNSNVLKWTNTFIPIGQLTAMTCSIFTGMVAYTYIGPPSDEFSNSNGVFGLVVRRVIDENVAYNILGSLMLCASCAAFMSTADSSVNAAASLFTLDFMAPLATKYKLSNGFLLLTGKIISITIAIIVLYCSQIDFEMGALITLQGMILCQVAPAYVLGFFNLNLQPYALLFGQVLGIGISMYYQCYSEYCKRSSVDVEWFGPWDGVQPGFFALIVNLFVSCCFSYRSTNWVFAWDKVEKGKFEDQLPTELLSFKSSERSRPWNTFPVNIVFFVSFILHCFTTPWWFDYYDSDDSPSDAADFPKWVWMCGFFRVMGDILLIGSVICGWQDHDSTKTPIAGSDLPATEL